MSMSLQDAWNNARRTRSPKLLVIGHGRHGKDTVAESLRDYYGWSFRSSSHWAAEHVIWPYNLDTLSAMYTAGRDWEWFFKHRHEEAPGCGRELWYNVMLDYNKQHGGAAIARGVLAEADIYVGMRSRYEFESAMDEEMFDHVIWVDRSLHEPREDSSSMELTESDANIIIDNNGTMQDLWYQVDGLASFLERNNNV